MDLFFSPLACSMSARIALAEAGAAVNFIEVDPDTKRVLATGEDYRAINPLGYVPALRLDDGTVLTENAAILQLSPTSIPARSSRRRSPIVSARAKLRQWLSFIGDRAAQGAHDAAARPRDAAGSEGLDGQANMLRASPISTTS